MDFNHVIWDFDGTLLNTYPHTARAFSIFLKKMYGVTENVTRIESRMRDGLQEAYEHYADKYDIEAMYMKKHLAQCEVVENACALPYINAHLVCKFIAEQGARNYLWTHRDTGALSMMQKHGFYELFSDFITEEDGFPRKPDPAALLHLIQKHDMDKEKTLYIGDREIDRQAARSAGVKFCFFTEDVNKTMDADFTVQNYSDLFYIINSTLTTKK